MNYSSICRKVVRQNTLKFLLKNNEFFLSILSVVIPISVTPPPCSIIQMYTVDLWTFGIDRYDRFESLKSKPAKLEVVQLKIIIYLLYKVVCGNKNKIIFCRLHMNIHYLERPFRCDSCSVSFRTKGHLQKHERSASHHNKVIMSEYQ